MKTAWDSTKSPGDLISSSDYNDKVTDIKTRGVPETDKKNGSDCSGADKDQGRVLTLDNTSLTKSAGWHVFREGARIDDNDVTFTHNASASTVTFDNTNIFNADKIIVTYFT